MYDYSDFSDEELEITELPEREEMLSVGLGGLLGLNISGSALFGIIGL